MHEVGGRALTRRVHHVRLLLNGLIPEVGLKAMLSEELLAIGKGLRRLRHRWLRFLRRLLPLRLHLLRHVIPRRRVLKHVRIIL